MNNAQDSAAFKAALDWRLRERDLDAEGWRAFADWIDANPANALALARVDAIDDTAVLAGMPRPDSRSFEAARTAFWTKRLMMGGTAMAAGIAAVVISIPRAQPITEIATRPGEIRTVVFGDGSRATLNGATILRYSGRVPRSIELAKGEAIFAVHHDAARPFRVTSRGDVIEDVGTVFNVIRSGTNLRVSVAEGSVTFDPRGARVKLVAGRELKVDRATGRAVVRSLASDVIGNWTSGLLSFSADSLSDVAGAFERRTGAKIMVDTDLMGRPFTGSVRVSGRADRDVPHLAALIGVDARYDGTRWILSNPR
jgi:transmembrane sensor